MEWGPFFRNLALESELRREIYFLLSWLPKVSKNILPSFECVLRLYDCLFCLFKYHRDYIHRLNEGEDGRFERYNERAYARTPSTRTKFSKQTRISRFHVVGPRKTRAQWLMCSFEC